MQTNSEAGDVPLIPYSTAPAPGVSTPDLALNGCKPGQGLPDIYFVPNARLRDLTAEVLDAMALANKRSPRLFQRDGALVRVIGGSRNSVTVEPLDVDRLRLELDHIANFWRPSGFNQRTSELEYKPAFPPLDLCRAVLAVGNWPLQELVAVTRGPIVRDDWSVTTELGYDAGTGLWYSPVGDLRLQLPDAPAPDDVQAAVTLLMEALADFPFDGDASLANALALLFTMILRPRIPGCVPLAVVEAPTPGSGKGLLLRVLWLIATGEQPSPENLPENEEELRKKITALLVRGDSLVLFDNVSHFVTSDVFSAVLTASTWSDRMLGLSKVVTVPQCATWTLTGNNVQIGRDMLRRVYRIRIDTGLEHPERRSGFHHPDLEHYVVEHRGEFLGAVLTIWLAWNLADRPQAAKRAISGGFQPWANLMADLLAFSGVPGFLDNRSQDDDGNDEAIEWAEFLATWHRLFGDRPMLMSELLDEIRNVSSALRAAVPTLFIESLGRDDLAKRLGHAFRHQVGIPRGEQRLRLARSIMSTAHRVRWCVVTPNETMPAADAASGVGGAPAQPVQIAWEAGVKGAPPPPDAPAPAAFLGDDLLAYLPEATRELSLARRAVAVYAHDGYRPVALASPNEPARSRLAGHAIFARLAALIVSCDVQSVAYAYHVLRWLADGGVGEAPAWPTTERRAGNDPCQSGSPALLRAGGTRRH